MLSSSTQLILEKRNNKIERESEREKDVDEESVNTSEDRLEQHTLLRRLRLIINCQEAIEQSSDTIHNIRRR